VSVLLSELNTIEASLRITSSSCGGWFACKFKNWFGSNEKTRLFISANAWWADESFSYKSSFVSQMEKDQKVKFYKVNFRKASEQAREKINRWVEKNTQNRIKELIPPAGVNTDTRLVLTNSLYFKGTWAIPFKREKIQSKPFILQNGETVQVPMMQHQDKFYYAENDQLQMLHLPYRKNKLAMLILLPKPNHTVQDLERGLNTTYFSQLLLESYKQDVMVSLPKFNMESTFGNLDKPLQALGWTDAFNDKADFSKITKDKLLISDIIQKVMIQVDEAGTIAAAATAAVMEGTVYMPTVPFEVSRPFLFIIYDTESKLVLFLGQVLDPRHRK
jgi:serpin B